jgi:hypothetical protein
MIERHSPSVYPAAISFLSSLASVSSSNAAILLSPQPQSPPHTNRRLRTETTKLRTDNSNFAVIGTLQGDWSKERPAKLRQRRRRREGVGEKRGSWDAGAARRQGRHWRLLAAARYPWRAGWRIHRCPHFHNSCLCLTDPVRSRASHFCPCAAGSPRARCDVDVNFPSSFRCRPP